MTITEFEYRRARGLLAVCVAMALRGGEAAGAIQTVSDPAHPAWNDRIDWATTGLAFDYLANPFTARTSGGITLEVGSPSGLELERADEGTGWLGNFLLGDALLYSGFGSPGPIRIDFDQPVRGAGAKFQPAAYGDFVVEIEVYDPAGFPLGTVVTSGVSTPTQDGTALFLGFLSDGFDVGSIRVDVRPDDPQAPGDFAMGRLQVSAEAFVPEGNPAWGWILIGGCLIWGWRRAKTVTR